jgi:hypothetical protein
MDVSLMPLLADAAKIQTVTVDTHLVVGLLPPDGLSV